MSKNIFDIIGLVLILVSANFMFFKFSSIFTRKAELEKDQFDNENEKNKEGNNRGTQITGAHYFCSGSST